MTESNEKPETHTLYHFTSRERVRSIKENGIVKGDVPTSPTGGFNAPWLTNDASWSLQSWSKGSAQDKSSVRMTVEIPADDPNLVHWPTLAEQENVDSAWYDTLNQVGGGGADNWYVYRGAITPDLISKVDARPNFSFGQGVSTSEMGRFSTPRQEEYMRAHRRKTSRRKTKK